MIRYKKIVFIFLVTASLCGYKAISANPWNSIFESANEFINSKLLCHLHIAATLLKCCKAPKNIFQFKKNLENFKNFYKSHEHSPIKRQWREYFETPIKKKFFPISKV